MDTMELYKEALHLAEQGRIEDAVKNYSLLLEIAQKNEGVLGAAYNDLGVLSFHNNQHDRAAIYFGKAMEHHTVPAELQENIQALQSSARDFLGVHPVSRNGKSHHSPEGAGKKSLSDTVLKDLIHRIPLEARKILVIGCGDGAIGTLIKKKNAHALVIGMEKNADQAALAEKVMDRTCVADPEKVDFICPEKYFDCIIYLSGFEHFHEPLSVIRHHRKYLSDEGVLMAIVPNMQHFSVITALLSGEPEQVSEGLKGAGHFQLFTAQSLKSLFKNAGYMITGLKGHGLYPLPEKFRAFMEKVKPLSLLSEEFETETESYYYTISAKKAGTAVLDRAQSISYSSERIIPGKSDWKSERLHQMRYHYFAPLGKDRNVLDCGSGAGYGAAILSASASRVTAVEKDEEAILYSQKYYAKENIAFQKADILSLPRDPHYDRIYSFGVMEQIDKIYPYLSLMKGMLSHEGIFIASASNKKISSPDSSSPLNPFHMQEWTLSELHSLLKGFFSAVTLFAQFDEGIFPVSPEEESNAPHFIALCSQHTIHNAAEELDQAWSSRITPVIVVTHDNLAYTQQCLAGISRYTYNPYEIIIVDNASKDGTLGYLRDEGYTRIIENKGNEGFWESVRRGLALSHSEYVAVMHNDTIVSHNWLEKMREVLASDEKTAAAAPLTNNSPYRLQTEALVYDNIEEFLSCAGMLEKQNHGQVKQAELVSDLCLVMKRSALDKILPALAGHLVTGKKICKSLKKAGFTCAVARNTLVHHIQK